MARIRLPATARQAKRWTITLNNPSEGEINNWKNAHGIPILGINYLVFQKERGAEGTEHLQGYIEFKTKRRMGAIKTMLGNRCHLELAMGTASQNKTYCTKEESRIDGPFEYGNYIEKLTLKDTIKAIKNKEVKNMSDLFENYTEEAVKHHSGLTKALEHFGEDRNWPMDVKIYTGDSGSGKSYDALHYSDAKDTFCPEWPEKKGSTWWWAGYEGQKTVVLDEFAHQIKPKILQKLMDFVPMTVQIKGGNVKFQAKTLIITSNIPPEKWYPRVENTLEHGKLPLQRRINDYCSNIVKYNGKYRENNVTKEEQDPKEFTFDDCVDQFDFSNLIV